MTKQDKTTEAKIEVVEVPSFTYDATLVSKHADIKTRLELLQAEYDKAELAKNTRDAGAIYKHCHSVGAFVKARFDAVTKPPKGVTPLTDTVKYTFVELYNFVCAEVVKQDALDAKAKANRKLEAVEKAKATKAANKASKIAEAASDKLPLNLPAKVATAPAQPAPVAKVVAPATLPSKPLSKDIQDPFR
jgi:hypothetical protein